jgi:hypothetical protein
MKFFLLFCLLLPVTIYAQFFAPVGATWHYTAKEVFGGPGDEYALEARVIKDTIVHNKMCREIWADQLCWHPSETQYVYNQGDSVFLYDALLEDFKLIYDFNGTTGDRIVIPIPRQEEAVIDTVILTIDSTDAIEINNIELKVQFVTYQVKYTIPSGNPDFSYSSEIIEIIGDTYFLFHIPLDATRVCDANYSDGLRCYEDSYLGHYETGIAPACDYSYVSVEDVPIHTHTVYPNPTNGELFLENEFVGLHTVEVIESNGRKIRTFTGNDPIDLKDLQNGIYFLKIIDKELNFYIEKVIKYGE